MSVKIVSTELRPNRNLVDPNFESYKLSLSSLPAYNIKLNCDIHLVPVGDNSYLYERIKCLTLYNYLTFDDWNNQIYFVDSYGYLRRLFVSIETSIGPIQTVYKIESNFLTSTDKLPVSILFPSPLLCIVCDGDSKLIVLETGQRKDDNLQQWNVQYEDNSINCPCEIKHSVFRSTTVNGKIVEYLDILLVKFMEFENSCGDSNYTEKISVEWISLQQFDSENKFDVIGTRCFEGTRVPNYLALNKDCSEMHIAANCNFKFIPGWEDTFDIVKSDETNNKNEIPPYTWKQNQEEIIISMQMPPDGARNHISYSLSPKNIHVGIRETLATEPKTILSGPLYLDADPESSNWTIANGKLEITIQKKEENRTWITVVEGDDRGKFEPDPKEVAEIHERLEHLTSESINTEENNGALFNSGQLEECDAYFNSSASLVCFNAEKECITHAADISSLRWLFNISMSTSEPPLFVLRHDVDAVAWQPNLVYNHNDALIKWKHISTYNALGYVHASKNNIKFCSAAPDTNYAAFCECQRRIFVYRQPSPISTMLRNRNSGQAIGKVAIQQVANVPGDDILGFVASNTHMYVLTSEELIIFKMTTTNGF